MSIVFFLVTGHWSRATAFEVLSTVLLIASSDLVFAFPEPRATGHESLLTAGSMSHPNKIQKLSALETLRGAFLFCVTR